MAIVGPLRELGMHDLLQLLDMSRKTGLLRVADDAGADVAQVQFRGGRILDARMRGLPERIEDVLAAQGRISALELEHARRLAAAEPRPTEAIAVLVRARAVTQRDVDRVVREHLETIVYDLLTWRDGTFTFEEVDLPVPTFTRVTLNTGSLIMESARRTDEWARIAHRVPGLMSVPRLVGAGPAGSVLQLRPEEWEVLMLVDGDRTLQAIAQALSRAPVQVAQALFALTTTGLVEVA